MRVTVSPEADAVLDEVWRRGDPALYEALEEAIDLIEAGDRRARRHALRSTLGVGANVWVIAVRAGGGTWAVVWQARGEEAVVIGVGETTAF